MNIYIKFLFILNLLVLSFNMMAQISGFGGIAEQITEGPMSLLLQFLYASSYVLGTFFLFKAYEGFKGHRVRPETLGITYVYFMAAFGLVLILLPMVHYLVDKVN